ncbi:MAG: 2-phospho-L-lactate guanylyltransferase [Caldilineaceae bacterium]
MNLWLLLPVKPFAQGKSRLASVLTEGERRSLNQALLQHVLATALSAKIFSGATVISRDPRALELARSHGVEALAEQGSGLNRALAQGRCHAMAKQADALLVLPADLPLLTIEDLHSLVQQATSTSSVVIAPSPDGGTNALFLQPPTAIPFRFGRNSFKRHCAAAQRAQLPIHSITSPGLQTDIDLPQQLAALPGSLLSALAHSSSLRPASPENESSSFPY